MKHPKIAQVFERDRFFKTMKGDSGSLPKWAFDFISVHDNSGAFFLCSPLKLVWPSGLRPAFENVSFQSKESAISAAKDICTSRPEERLFVVLVQ